MDNHTCLPVCQLSAEQPLSVPVHCTLMFAHSRFLQMQPVFASVRLVPFDYDQSFSRTVMCVCVKMFYLTREQFSLHSSRLFLLIFA